MQQQQQQQQHKQLGQGMATQLAALSVQELAELRQQLQTELQGLAESAVSLQARKAGLPLSGPCCRLCSRELPQGRCCPSYTPPFMWVLQGAASKFAAAGQAIEHLQEQEQGGRGAGGLCQRRCHAAARQWSGCGGGRPPFRRVRCSLGAPAV